MPSKHPARAVFAIIFVIMASQLSSCGGPGRPPETDVAGYTALRMKLGDRDFSPLADRRILIDPGHGGFFRGAVGQGGVSEAEVNLGVALYLRGLLEWAGAEVQLTRTADYDFLSPADSNLAVDLGARVALSDSLQPDVFLSIHHNSNASLDRTLNETQTYYPVGRDGADLDLARSVHKHLVQVLGISPAKILPGNFHVLRNNTAVSVLGEPAMLSNPVIEQRLSLAAKQELEAQAYFLGLLEYFSGGVPTFECAHGDTIEAEEKLTWRFTDDTPGAPKLDPSSVKLSLDGQQQTVSVAPDGRTITWRKPRGLEGEHRLSLKARNLAGRSTSVIEHLWRKGSSGPWRATIWYCQPAGDAEFRQSQLPDRALLTWESPGEPLETWPELTLECRRSDGSSCSGRFAEGGWRLPSFPGRRGWALVSGTDFPYADLSDFYFVPETQPPTSDTPLAAPAHLEAAEFVDPWTFHMLDLPPGVWSDQVVPGGNWRARSVPEPEWQNSWGYRTSDPVLPVREDAPFWIEADGARPIFGDEEHLPPWNLPGATPASTLSWEPLLPDLIGRVIILDPAGGGRDTQGLAPLGTRGAELNQRIAEMLAVLLRGAGCEVHLTRGDERWIAPEAKVLLANEVGANLFLTIGRSLSGEIPWGATYCHGSRRGEQWADLIAAALQPLAAAALDTAHVQPAWDYLLRHTACPALHVTLPHATTIQDEERLTNPSWQQAVARGLMLGTARLLSDEVLDVLHPGELLSAQVDGLPRPADIRWVQLDGNFPWLPPTWSGALPETPGLPLRGDHGLLEIRTDHTDELWAFRRGAGSLTDLRLVHKYIGEKSDGR